MSFVIPHTVVGATRTAPEARAGFGGFLDQAADGTPGALVADGSTWVWDALGANGRRQSWDVLAMVPNVAGYVREATDYGMFGAGWRRFRRMNPLSWFGLGFQCMLNARGVLRRDFPTLLKLLLELEMANFRRFRPRVVFLHPQMTDLLLGMDHAKAMENAIRKIRRGFRAEAGLATNNLGVLLPRLRAWGLEVDFVLSSIHPRGYGMRPSREQCEEALTGFQGKLVATLNTPYGNHVAAYWRELDVASAVYESVGPTLAEWRQWQGWPDAEQPAAPARHKLVEVGA
jgi:hypothetical protein